MLNFSWICNVDTTLKTGCISDLWVISHILFYDHVPTYYIFYMIIIIQLWLLGIIIIILLLLLILISNTFVGFFLASSSNKVFLNWFTWFSWWNVDADCFFINRLIWQPWIWDHMILTFKINAAIYWLSLGTSIQESIEVIIHFRC